MARVTVEDCVSQVKNRFELVAVAAQRAKNIAAGSPITVERDNDKNPVVALREIAGKTVSVDQLREQVIQGIQKYGNPDTLQPKESNTEINPDAIEIREEMEQLIVMEDRDQDGWSFSDENMDADD